MKYQVVVLAGGESSRFFPFNGIHKSFYKLLGKTILERTIESVKKVDPSEIILVLGAKNFDREKEICKSLPVFEDVKIVKEEKPLGQADAVLSAGEHIKDDFFVINANQFNFHLIAEKFIKAHSETGDDATIGVTETDNPSKYGIADLDGARVRAVVEKPLEGKEPSNMRLVGVYLFSKDFVDKLSQTPISDCALEETLDMVAKEGRVGSVHIGETLPSIKYPWDILRVKDAILPVIGSSVDPSAIIENTVIIKGEGVVIEKNAHIYDFALIEGPCYIGEGAIIGSYCQVRKGAVIGRGAEVERYCDIKNSIIGEGTHIHSGFVGDSVIGENCRIGAGFVTANKRLDRGNVNVSVKGEKKDTGLKNLGVFIGDETNVGIRVSAMPGAVAGEKSLIFPGVVLRGTCEAGSKIDR